MKKIKILIIFLAIIFAFPRCNSDNQSKKTETIKIGAILPMTGDFAKLGESGRNGLLMAQEYINSKMSKKIDIILEDGQGKPVNSINALNKLIFSNDSITIFSIVSPVDLSLLPIQKKKGFLFISHSTHPKLSNVNNLVFRHSTTAGQESSMIVDYFKNQKDVIVVCSNDDYGLAFSDQISNLKPEWNHVIFDKSESNFNAIINKINIKAPNKIIICAAGKSTSNIITKLREKGNKSEIVTPLGFKSSGADLLIASDTNITMIDFKEIEIGPEFKETTNEFFKNNGRMPNPAEIIFFNSALLIYQATIEAKSFNPTAIAFQLKNKNFHLLGGEYKITNENDIIPEIKFKKHK